MSETVEITRYPNRRLYDRQQKKYVNVGEIEAMVLEGRDVRVTDNKSGEDLTRLILTQVILERHPERMKMFPVSFLHEILRADQAALDWFTVYFAQAKSLMESVTGASGMPLLPGLDFWQAFMPANAGVRATTVQDDAVDKGSQAETTASGDTEARSDQPPQEHAAVKSQQEMAARLVALERRLMQLEREAKEAKESD